jgi:hypothetical protein
MPDYGLLVKNTSNEIQIDSIYRNLSLEQVANGVTISNGNSAASCYTRVALTSSPLTPIFLIQPNTDDFVAVRNYYKSGSNFEGVDIYTKYNQSTIINWKSYRENRIPSGDIYGLLVYNSSGQLCFDSGKKYFKIFSVHTINLSAPSTFGDGDYEDITHAGISNPFYLLSPNSFYTYAIWNDPQHLFYIEHFTIGLKKLTSTSVRVGWFPFGHYSLPGTPSNQGLNPTMKLIVCGL